MAVLRQEIYIGSITNPLFYFNEKHISDPISIQSVDLIEETLSIDSLEITVYYEGTDYETLRTLPFGTSVFYYTEGTLTYKFYIKNVERLSRNAFKLNCISAIGILDKSYHRGGVYYGRTFGSLIREVVSEFITDSAPEDSVITYNNVTVSSINNYLLINGTVSSSFILSFGPWSDLTAYNSVDLYFENGSYELDIESGDEYQIILELISGSIVKNGVTYTPESDLVNGIVQVNLMQQNATSLNNFLIRAETGPSNIIAIYEDLCLGMNMFLYGDTQFNNAKFNVYLRNTHKLSYSMSEAINKTRIFGWLPYDTKRNNLHQILFAINGSVLKDEEGDMYFDFVDNDTVVSIDDDRMYIDGSIEYPAIPTEINITEHSYQYDNNIEPINVVDNSTSGEQNGLYIFDNAPIVAETLTASEGITIISANENYALIDGTGIITGVPYYDKTNVVTRTYDSGGEPYSISVTDATLVSSMNSNFIADRLLMYYTSSRTVKGDVKLQGEKTGKRYSFTDAFGDSAIGYLKKMTIYPSSFFKAMCEFTIGYSSTLFGNMYEYHTVIEEPGTLIVPSGVKRMLVTMIGGGDGGSSGFAGEDPEIDWVNDPYECYKNQTGGKGGAPGEPGLGGKIYRFLVNNPVAGNWTCFLGLGGEGGEENDSHEENNLGTSGDNTKLTSPNNQVYSTNNTAAYRSEYGIMDLFTGTVYGRKGHIGAKGGNGGRGVTNGTGDNGEDITFNGITYYGGYGGEGCNFSFRKAERSAYAGGSGGNGAQAFADGANGCDARITKYADMTAAYTQYDYKVVEQVGFGPGIPESAVPVYGYFPHSPGDGGDAGHGGAGRGGYGGCDVFTDAYTDTDEKKVWLNSSTSGAGVTASFSSPGLAAGDGLQGAIFIYSDAPLQFNPRYLVVPVLTDTTNHASANKVTLRIRTNNTNDTVAIQRREIISDIWVEIDRRVYSSPGNYTFTDNLSENGKSYEYRAISLGLGSAVDSEYSNSIVTGFGGTKLDSPAPVCSTTYYGIHLEWPVVTNATSYLIAAKPEGDEYDWTYSITDETFSDLFCDSNERFFFKVLSLREDGIYIASNWSSIVSGTAPSVSKVITPVILSGNYTETGGYHTGTGITIKWNQAYGYCADYYRIERRLSGNESWDFVGYYDDPASGSYYDEFIVRNNQVWEYRIKGYREDWLDSDYSEVFSVRVDRSLPAPTFDSLSDAGLDIVALSVSVSDIDGRATHLVWEVSVNGGDWVTEYTTVLGNGTIDPEPTFQSTLYGSHISSGGYIKVRCYVRASNYSNSQPSNVLDVTVNERVFFYMNDASMERDPSSLTGDWAAIACGWSNSDTAAAMPTVSERTSSGERSTTISANNGTGVYRTNNEIDLSLYSKVCLVGEVRKEASTCRSAFGLFALNPGGYGFMNVTANALALVYKLGADYGTIENPSISVGASITASIGFAVTGDSEYGTYGECYMKSVFAIKKS